MMDHFAAFEQFAVRLRPQIDAQLERYMHIASGCPDRLRDAMRHGLLAPGKRLRPLLVLSAAEICGAPYRAGDAGGLRRRNGARLFADPR